MMWLADRLNTYPGVVRSGRCQQHLGRGTRPISRVPIILVLTTFSLNCMTEVCLHMFVSQSIQDEPVHILNVAIKTDSDIDDDGLAAMFREFTQTKVRCLG